jgi:hypothetical protein
MMRIKVFRRTLWATVFCLIGASPSPAVDNLRVAYPSLNTSVFALIIAQKQGYFK